MEEIEMVLELGTKVEIDWFDAISKKDTIDISNDHERTNWEDIEKVLADCNTYFKITSIGYFIGQGEVYTAIGMSIKDNMVQGYLAIPNDMILNIKVIPAQNEGGEK